MILTSFVYSHFHLLTTTGRMTGNEYNIIFLSDLVYNYRDIRDKFKQISPNVMVFIIKDSLFYRKFGILNPILLFNLSKIFFLVLILKLMNSIFIIFNDASLGGYILRFSGAEYILSEDSTNYFKRIVYDIDSIFNAYQKRKFLDSLNNKKLLEVQRLYGTSKFVRSIEVSEIIDIGYLSKNTDLVKKSTHLLASNFNDFAKIISSFVYSDAIEELNGIDESEYSLVLTQPFFEEDLNLNKLFTLILKNFKEYQKILLKPHPRDRNNYVEYLKSNTDSTKIVLLNSNYPIELVSFFKHIKISRVISFSSSTNLNLDHVEYINLGFDALEKVRTNG